MSIEDLRRETKFEILQSVFLVRYSSYFIVPSVNQYSYAYPKKKTAPLKLKGAVQTQTNTMKKLIMMKWTTRSEVCKVLRQHNRLHSVPKIRYILAVSQVRKLQEQILYLCIRKLSARSCMIVLHNPTLS